MMAQDSVARATQELTTPGDHLSQVLEAFTAGGDARLVQLLQAAVAHLHAFVDEVQLTREEWMAGIQFLTAVGARCDDVRQEFILLSDTLGVSMLLEMVNARPAQGASEPTVLGPFYVPGAPALAFGASIVSDPATGGSPLAMSGTVGDLAGVPVDDACLEVWQVQPNGRYDIEDDPDRRNLRGSFRTGSDGSYRFETVRPVDYTIPEDGPVGTMLRATGRLPWRPAHLHFKVTAAGYKPLVTHLFDASSPWLDRDVVFGVRPSLAADMSSTECRYDFRLEASGV